MLQNVFLSLLFEATECKLRGVWLLKEGSMGIWACGFLFNTLQDGAILGAGQWEDEGEEGEEE